MGNIKIETHSSPELIIIVFLRPFLNFVEIQLTAAGQFIIARIIQNDSLSLYLRFKIVGFRQRIVEVVYPVIDKLGLGMERSVLVLKKASAILSYSEYSIAPIGLRVRISMS